jgi:hypothetical protein
VVAIQTAIFVLSLKDSGFLASPVDTGKRWFWPVLLSVIGFSGFGLDTRLPTLGFFNHVLALGSNALLGLAFVLRSIAPTETTFTAIARVAANPAVFSVVHVVAVFGSHVITGVYG